MSKYKEFQEYCCKVRKEIRDITTFHSDTVSTFLMDVIDAVLECYLSNVKPKDCAAKLLGKEV